jgi:hypothetical protein
MNRWTSILWLLSFALTASALGGCSTAASSDSIEVGSSVEMGLKVGRTTQINQITYTVTGPNYFMIGDLRRGRLHDGRNRTTDEAG